MYPYEPRLSTVNSFKVNFTKAGQDYSFSQQTTFFQRSRTCLEQPWWDQLNLQIGFAKRVNESFKDWGNSWTEEELIEKAQNPEADGCEAAFFEKIMFSGGRERSMRLSDLQEINLMQD